MQKALKRTLTFMGTGGNDEAELMIEKRSPIDLTPFFKNIFDEYNYHAAWKRHRRDKRKTLQQYQKELGCNYEENKSISTFRFRVDELLAMTMMYYDPVEFGTFLKHHMVDPKDFGNETLLKRLNDFKDVYSRIRYHVSGNHFMIQPLDKDVDPLLIEEMIAPPKKKTQKAIGDFLTLNPSKAERVTTRPYHCRTEDSLEYAIGRLLPEKKVLRVYKMGLPELNYFSIINKYNLPVKRLKVVEK